MLVLQSENTTTRALSDTPEEPPTRRKVPAIPVSLKTDTPAWPFPRADLCNSRPWISPIHLTPLDQDGRSQFRLGTTALLGRLAQMEQWWSSSWLCNAMLPFPSSTIRSILYFMLSDAQKWEDESQALLPLFIRYEIQPLIVVTGLQWEWVYRM